MRNEKHRRWIVVAAVVLAGLAGGCSDSGTEPLEVFVTVSADPPSISLTGASTITAQLRTNRGEAGAGRAIEYGSTLGALFVTAAGSSNAQGRGTVTLRGDGTAGVAVVTARDVASGAQGQVQVRIGLD
jgi:hypothetical protein